MSTKKLDISQRVRTFRTKAKLSQAELGERLGVSGNYIYLIESGNKPPGLSLVKLFEHLELSPQYGEESASSGVSRDSGSVSSGSVPPNSINPLLKTETLLKNFSEISEKLVSDAPENRKFIIGQLREMLDEIESRVLASSGPLSEAQQIAVRAASRRGAKRGA
jgi:transcriptional regulator with XRE-family HTH domain